MEHVLYQFLCRIIVLFFLLLGNKRSLVELEKLRYVHATGENQEHSEEVQSRMEKLDKMD